MNKTTVYLPDDLKTALSRTARQRGVSEAELIRTTLRRGLDDARPRPRGGVFRGSEPIAERADDLLAQGFGE